MNGDASRLKHGELTQKIIGVFYDVYNELGHGFAESVYQKAMLIALAQAGLRAEEKAPVKVWFRGHCVGNFEADILVEGLVFLELKGCKAIDPGHESQLLNYLRATEVEVGLILNFGPKPEFRRFAFDNIRKASRGTPPAAAEGDASD
jgi:GxxExxY protein